MPDAERACFCRYCIEKYRRENNSELPQMPDWDSEVYRKSFLWRYRVNVNGIKRIYETVKAKCREAVLVYNSHPLGWKGRANKIVELARDYIDVIFAECSEADYQPPGFIAEMVKLSLAVSGGKPVWASRNSFHMCLTTAVTTPVAIRQGLREAFIAGGYPLYLVFSTAFANDPRVDRGVAQVYRELEKLEEYMEDSEPLRYAAILFSNRSRDWGGRDRPDHVTDSFRGFYYALTWHRLPVTYICDTDLDEARLEGFKVIVLANAYSLSKKAAKTVADFSEKGGVVASYLTSIMDEQGNFMEEFGLSEVLGVSYEGVVEIPWSYVKVIKSHEVLGELKEGSLILWGDFDREFIDSRVPAGIANHAKVSLLNEAKALARVVAPRTVFGYEYENGRSPPQPGAELNAPAIVVREEARTVYFSGQIGRIYWRIGMPDLETLIVNSVLWSGGLPPLEVKGPGLIQVEAYKRSGQIIVHLLNLTYDRRLIVRGNTAITRGWASTAESVHPSSSVVPLTDFSVIIREGEFSRAYSPLSGRKFAIKYKNGVHRVKVPSINEYEVLVLE